MGMLDKRTLLACGLKVKLGPVNSSPAAPGHQEAQRQPVEGAGEPRAAPARPSPHPGSARMCAGS